MVEMHNRAEIIWYSLKSCPTKNIKIFPITYIFNEKKHIKSHVGKYLFILIGGNLVVTAQNLHKDNKMISKDENVAQINISSRLTGRHYFFMNDYYM